MILASRRLRATTMSEGLDSPAEALSGREIVTTRVFDTPRYLVLKA